MDSGVRLLNIPHAFVLSIVLIFAFIIRINLASFVYFVFSLIIPIVSFSSNSGHFRRTLICVVTWSIVCIGAQFIYNFVPRTWLFPIFKALFSLKVRRRDIGWECDEVHNLLGQIGLHQLRGKAPAAQWLNVLAPDVLILLVTIILLWRIRLSRSRALFFPKEYYAYDTKLRPDVVYSPLATNEFQQPSGYFQSSKFHNMILCVGFCLVGSLYPSLHTAPFFIAFVALATIWAFHRIEVQPAMWRGLRLCAQLLACMHLCFLYIYQLPSVHRRLTPQTLLARLFGFVPYINHQCFRRVTLPLAVETWLWPEILSPILIFCLHWMVSYQLSANLVENMEDTELVNESQITNKTQTTMTASEMSAGGTAQESAIPIIKIEGVRSRTGSLGSTVSTVKNIMAETIADGAKLLGLDANINQLKWESVEKFVQKNNYILCLLTMMAWSLLYHSWSTFVLLLTACLVWMHPRTELICRHIMPLISIYAEVLLLLNLIYALPLTQSELPEYNYLRQLGVEKPHDHPPCMDLILKSIFNFVFWMTLNKNAEMAEARDVIQDESNQLESIVVVKPEKDGKQKAIEHDESFIRSLSQLLHLVLSDFWILFVLAVLLYISVQQPVATYRIVYMAMFLGFVNLFQISFPKWRRMMYTFWMAMIAYCLFLLTLLYTYQFHGVPEFYTETLGLADDVTRSLGLERISSGELLFRLLTPISFLIFTLIQVNYCHERLLMITEHWETEAYGSKLRFLMSKLKIFHKQMNYLEGPLGIAGAPSQKRPSSASYQRYYNRRSSASHPFYPHLHLPSKERLYLMLGRLEEKCKQMFEYRQSLWNIGWRIIEIHLHKFIAFYMVYVALNEVSILNFFLLIGAAALVCADSLSEDVATYSAILTTVIILLKMLYQLEFIRDDMITKICHESSATSNVTAHFGDWFGLTKSDSVFDLTKMHLGLIFLFCCKTIVHIRQFMHRNALRLEEPPKGILFPGIDRSMADKDLFHCALYMSNYFFYRFGVEVCMISTVVTIGYRSDFYSAIYTLCLIALFLMSREEKRRYWPRYLIFLFALFIWQYFICIGIPSYLCWGYPWDDSDRVLVEWLNIPSTKHPANSFKLMADFAQLACVSCQLFAFKLEIKYGDNYEGGSNHDTTTTVWKGARTFLMTFNLKLFKVEGDQSVQKIGVPDFISESRTFLDRLKHIYFMYFYWITLAIIFVAGTTRVTIFSAGYILGCFFFLWMGNSLFFKPIAAVMRLWDLLMLYNVIAVFLKISLQAIGCVYMGSLYKNFCWLMQLFGIACFQSAIILPDSDDGTSLGCM
ncbi:piezo-type mechanosensitive ion channel component [Ditylenchus destructor]|uniref:Piezo-type mechanosensitive ion channel component n=1 Tax=Ditylenchus destructor TaxID=166010 RepID=A0AAD4N670_9BILA|nr:piezo-type mechanosensitive ion channel component [Ditylenchus destructor]